MSLENHQKNRYLYKCIIKESSKAAFKGRLSKTSWGTVKSLDNANESYIKFIETIIQICDPCKYIMQKRYFPRLYEDCKGNTFKSAMRSNYWLIYVLPYYSKLLERLMYILNFLNDYCIINYIQALK